MLADTKVLIGAVVNQLKFSNQWVELSLYGGANREKKYATLQIEADFVLAKGDKKYTIVASDHTTLAPMLPLLGTSIRNINISDKYVITVGFSDGSNIKASPIPEYESWNLSGDDIGFTVAQGF